VGKIEILCTDRRKRSKFYPTSQAGAVQNLFFSDDEVECYDASYLVAVFFSDLFFKGFDAFVELFFAEQG
jgi:hypothetical protein